VSPTLEEYVKKLGLEKVEDFRGRWKHRLDAYSWALENLFDECNERILANMCIHYPHWPSLSFELRDYLVAVKAFTFDLSASPKNRRDYQLREDILKRAKSPGVVMGWHCVRDTEKEHVAQAARWGLFVLCSHGASNLTVHGGIQTKCEFKQEDVIKPEDVEVERKIYVTFLMTDGDALWAMENLQSWNWLHENRGKFAFNWGIQPLLVELAPGILEYYYSKRTPNDFFVNPVSGAGYTYPYLHPSPRKFLELSQKYATKAGTQHCYNIVNWNPFEYWGEAHLPWFIELEREVLKDSLGVLRGFGGTTYIDNYLSEDFVNIHSAFVLFKERGIAEDLKVIAKAVKERPLFLFIYVQIARNVFDTLSKEIESLGPEFKVVRADEFMSAIRRAIKDGLIAKKWGEAYYPDNPDLRKLVEKDGLVMRWSRVVKEVKELLALVENSNHETLIRKLREKYGECDDEEMSDVIAYDAAITCLNLVRAALHLKGVYENEYEKGVKDFLKLYEDLPGNEVAEYALNLLKSWHNLRISEKEAIEFSKRVVELAKHIAMRLKLPDLT